jgi:hypothetical protein
VHFFIISPLSFHAKNNPDGVFIEFSLSWIVEFVWLPHLLLTPPPPMMFTNLMGTNTSNFHTSMQNYDAHSMPWVSSHFPIDISNLPSTFPSSPWPNYMNPSIGSGGTMAPLPTYFFDMSHVPQPTLTVGGWNLPSYGSSPSYALSGASAQMRAYSTYYTPSVYPLSIMSAPS